MMKLNQVNVEHNWNQIAFFPPFGGEGLIHVNLIECPKVTLRMLRCTFIPVVKRPHVV